MRCALILARLWALGTLIGFGSPAAAQPTVVVRAESRIELRTDRTPEGVWLRGVLRDDLGRPQQDREVQLRLTDEGPGQNAGGRIVLRDIVRTDDDGEFSARAPVSSGDFVLTANFEGDPLHHRAEVSRAIDLDRADVRLRVRVPAGGRLDLDEPTHEIEVRAVSTLATEGIEITLLDELDRPLAVGVTSASGAVLFRVESKALGSPGAGRLKARSRADDARAGAQTEVPIVRFRLSVLTLEADRERAVPGEVVRFTGHLGDRDGDLGRRAIGLFAGETHLSTVLTDAGGEFTADVEIGEEHPSPLVATARFSSDAPGREGTESPAVTVIIEGNSGGSWAFLWSLLPITACLALLFLLSRKSPARLTKAPAPSAPPAGIVASLRSQRRPDLATVAGHVIDRDSAGPIAAARVTLRSAGALLESQTDAEGHFSVDEIPAGSYEFRVEARGYEAAEGHVTSPHRGEWSGMSIRMASLRAEVLGVYRRVALALLPSSRLWGIWTKREVLAHARAKGAPPSSGLPDLTGEVEQAFYSADGPTEEDLERIREQARRSERELAGGTSSGDPNGPPG